MNKSGYIEELEKTAIFLKKFINELQDKTFFVSGATGMIGSDIINVLLFMNKIFKTNIIVIAAGRNIEKLRKEFVEHLNDNFLILCETDYHTICYDATIDYVIHCAAITQTKYFIQNSSETIISNFETTKNLLEFAKNKKIKRFVYLSSVEVYGQANVNQTVFFEDDLGYLNLKDKRNCYPESKRMLEMLTRCYCIEHDINSLIVRPAKTYTINYKDDDKRIFTEFLHCVKSRKDIILKSDGLQRFSCCFSLDVVTGIITAIFLGNENDIYNISDDNSNTCAYEIATIFANNSNINVLKKIESNQITGYTSVSHTLVNSDKLVKLGWHPTTNLHDGIAKLLQ